MVGGVDREDAEIQHTCVCARSRGFQEERGENKQPVGMERLGIESFLVFTHLIHQNMFMHTH